MTFLLGGASNNLNTQLYLQRFDHNAKLLSTRFGQDFEVEVQARFLSLSWLVFCRWCFVEVMNLNFGDSFGDSKTRFGQFFEF